MPARTVEWSIGGNEVVRSLRLRVGELGSSWLEFKDLLWKPVLSLLNRIKKKRFLRITDKILQNKNEPV